MQPFSGHFRKGRPGAPFVRRALGWLACAALLAGCAGGGDAAGEVAESDSAAPPAQVQDAAPPAPGPSVDAEDLAELDARDAAEFQRRQSSMESREACLARVQGVPDEARPRLVEACERLPSRR